MAPGPPSLPAGRPRRNAARLPRRRWRRIAVLLMTPVVDRWSETTTLLLLRRPSSSCRCCRTSRGVACYEYEYRRFAACVRCAFPLISRRRNYYSTPSNAKHAIKQARHNAPATVVRGISWRPLVCLASSSSLPLRLPHIYRQQLLETIPQSRAEQGTTRPAGDNSRDNSRNSPSRAAELSTCRACDCATAWS